jgi:hypothetical protein
MKSIIGANFVSWTNVIARLSEEIKVLAHGKILANVLCRLTFGHWTPAHNPYDVTAVANDANL